MAMLPPLSYGALQAAAKTGINVSDDTANTAEQYAAVFFLSGGGQCEIWWISVCHPKKETLAVQMLWGNTLSVKQSLENTYNAMEL